MIQIAMLLNADLDTVVGGEVEVVSLKIAMPIFKQVVFNTAVLRCAEPMEDQHRRLLSVLRTPARLITFLLV